jgi:ferredoxin
MQYKKIVVYFFSGTGNSRNVALWLSQAANADGVKCELINIAQIDRLNIPQPDPNALVVFTSPIHGFNYPPVMLHFIMRFPKGNNNVVLMNTRAGMLIGKFITPGLTGIAFYISMIALKIKGYSTKALLPVDLPSNWISLHPGLNDRTVNYLHERNKERVTIFAQKVLSGKSQFKALREIQDILVIHIAILYYIVGRFFLAKTFYTSADCNNCDICIKGCPVKAIINVDNRPFWTFNCESCMKCIGNCPKKAIEVGHGYVLAFVLLVWTPLIALFYKHFDSILFEIDNKIVELLFEWAIVLGSLAIWYRIVHYLMRFRIFERLIVFTSLTKYKFWGKKYKAPKQAVS